MPRPTTKNLLLAEIEAEHKALEDLLATLSPDQMTQRCIVGKWSVKDVLAHLIAWEQMYLGWYAVGLCGKIPAIPAEGFDWRQLPQLNQKIFEKYCEQELGDILKRFKASHRKIYNQVVGLSNEDIFTSGRYPWTGKLALVSYIVPNTSSHYRWARKEIRKGLKARLKST